MKISKLVLLAPLALIFSSCDPSSGQKGNDPSTNNAASAPSVPTGQYTLTAAFPNLVIDLPVELTSPDDGTDRIFVIAQKGKIHVFPNQADVKTAPVFLDITDRIVSGGERGLLGLAFHPKFKENGYFYVNYTGGNPLTTYISRFKVNQGNPNTADPKSEEILLTYRQPYSNHNGGKVAFGNDGYLYIASGDGGSGGDPLNNGQNRKELLGKIIRIDVDNAAGSMKYGIPADNPFKNNTEGFREEIFAYGMRNPWRFNFDRKTGLLWAADVGQDEIEEVDIIEKGGNYGWRLMEANNCFNPANCDKTNLKLPIWTYPHGASTGLSITGGYVSHDKNLPGLEGKYIYGDYVSGNIWALTYEGNKAVKNEQIGKLDVPLSSFGEDAQNNLYVLAYTSGKIYKLKPGS
ncbi:PQQ-dependent sugar dehydrogenase [Adhaeribacter aquaticus]|uniref:PQQ-dependent sugar dehydrogenase n=1 Tax=Adhaeribacter aquaticus TaxID=299567 RepID=UPI00041FC12B|nr:PQQ-dependent sugar dehydrogenase [Adhaeribacter aquaticus]